MTRKNPTLPPRATSDLLSDKRDIAWQSIDLLPATHCACVGCGWTGDSEDSLCQHLQEAHEAHLQPCIQAATCQTWWRGDLDWHKKAQGKELRMLAYASLLSKKSQTQAPVASPQIDRRSLFTWSKSLTDDNICTLICFFCAQKHAYIRDECANDISYRTDVFTRKDGVVKFTELSMYELEDNFGVLSYKSRYAPHLSMR